MRKFKFIESETPINEITYPQIKSVNTDNTDSYDFYDFYDFSNGVHIDDTCLQEWINEIMDSLAKQDVGSYHSIASGNGLVIGCKSSDSITIYVTNSYKEAYIC